MAKRARKIETIKGLSLKIVNPNAAGIDIAATEMQVCVPADRDGENNRRFGCFTKDLQEISSYLSACGIETVAMESTEIYWLPLFMMLKEDGFDVILVNPRDINGKNGKIDPLKTEESAPLKLCTKNRLKLSQDSGSERRRFMPWLNLVFVLFPLH